VKTLIVQYSVAFPPAIDSRVGEAIVSMARGEVNRIKKAIRQGEQRGVIPNRVTAIVEFIHGMMKPDGNFIDAFVELMKTLLEVDPAIAEGIGCIVDETFH
jgi:hypothetical protein